MFFGLGKKGLAGLDEVVFSLRLHSSSSISQTAFGQERTGSSP